MTDEVQGSENDKMNDYIEYNKKNDFKKGETNNDKELWHLHNSL